MSLPAGQVYPYRHPGCLVSLIPNVTISDKNGNRGRRLLKCLPEVKHSILAPWKSHTRNSCTSSMEIQPHTPRHHRSLNCKEHLNGLPRPSLAHLFPARERRGARFKGALAAASISSVCAMPVLVTAAILAGAV